MPNRLRALALLCLTSVISFAADDLAQKVQRVEQGLRPSAGSQATMAERMAFYKVPGVTVAVVAGGKVEWARGYGVTSAADGKPVDAETMFQAASISKHVGALVALRLVDEGKLSLDEDVNQKLRSWKVPENEFTKTEKVTLRRLLNHSAGLTVHGFPGYAAGATLPTLPEILDGRKPANTAPVRVDVEPGSLWRYSGGGYEVMQLLVMDVAGEPFPELAKRLVLDPLHMTRSTFEQPLPERYRSNAAWAHRADGSGITGKWHTYPEMTAAGLWTTPTDLAKVVIELETGGHVLKPETQRQMLTKVRGNYGLGLQLAETEGQRSFAHGGSNAGFQCFLFGYLEGGRGAVVMTNGDRGGALANEIMRSIAAEYGWVDFRKP